MTDDDKDYEEEINKLILEARGLAVQLFALQLVSKLRSEGSTAMTGLLYRTAFPVSSEEGK